MVNRAFVAGASILASAIFFASLTLAEADARQGRKLPASMTGVWGWSAQSCTRAGDDGRVNIKARSVEFFAASYNLKKIVVRAGGAFHASAVIHEEGEPGVSRGNIDLKLLVHGRLSIRTDAAGSRIYIRCP